MKMGVVELNGRYTPTAKGSERTPQSSSTTAMITPKSDQNPRQPLVQDALGNQSEQLGLRRVVPGHFRAVVSSA